MKQKHLYTAPEAETLVVRFEANIMSPQGYHPGGGGSYGNGDTNENGDF
ncbi:MAG: hypothetical protein IKS02_00825 [Fibrobacter sp.]|nr:hypothetical protein [Fibrobacter sp.]